MRIAFVGKGGSGKSTITAACVLLLGKNATRPLFVVDADINQHLNRLLGESEFPSLNQVENFYLLRAHVRAESPNIARFEHVIRTTPPSEYTGKILLSSSDPLLSKLARWSNGIGYCATGAPLIEDIGTKCYHNNLAALEIFLNHVTDEDSIIVVDMLAGVDAFSTSLHIQFDAICLVVEPSTESVSVAREYLRLAEAHDVLGRIVCVANQIEDESDIEYLRSQQIAPTAVVPMLAGIRKSVRENGSLPVSDAVFRSAIKSLLGHIDWMSPIPSHERIRRLVALHRIQSTKSHHPASREQLLAQIES